MQYHLNCRNTWYGAQTILRVHRMGYCMFIEYFALWTWAQHALNAFKLNWSFVSLWLSTWFAIPPWKTISKQNLQYPYIGGVKYFNCHLIYFVWMHKSKLQYLHFILSSLVSTVGVYCSGNHVGKYKHVGGVW